MAEERIKKARSADVFVKIEAYDLQNRQLIVSSPKLMDSDSLDERFRVFVPPKNGLNPNTKWSGGEIDSRMEQFMPVGSTALLQALSVPLGRKMNAADCRPCQWIALPNQESNRQLSGALSFKGMYPKDPERAHEMAVLEIGYWHRTALIPGDIEYNTLLGQLTDRFKRVQLGVGKPPAERETLPYLGVMLRTELNGKLVEYSKPVANTFDLDPAKGKTLPLTAEQVETHVSKYTKNALKRYGPDARVSVMRYSTFHPGRSIHSSQVSRYRHRSTFSPRRGKHDQRDYYGGHYAINENAAMALANDRKVNGQQLITMFPQALSATSKPTLTALYAVSPYTGQKLVPAEHIDAAVSDYKFVPKPDASLPTSELPTEVKTKNDVASGGDEYGEANSMMNPPVGEDGLIDLSPYRPESAPSVGFSYRGLFRDNQNNILSSFRAENGNDIVLRFSELTMRIGNYQQAGLDTGVEMEAIDKLRLAETAQEIATGRLMKRQSGTNHNKQ